MSMQSKAEVWDSCRTAMEEASGATLDYRKLIQGRSATALASLFFSEQRWEKPRSHNVAREPEVEER